MSGVEMLCNCVRLPKRCGVALQLCSGCFILALFMASSTSTNHTSISDEKLRRRYLNDPVQAHWIFITFISFTIFYILSNILSGFLCLKYSAGRLLGMAMSGLSVLHIMSSLSTEVGQPEALLVACLKGLFMGFTLPPIITICNVQIPNVLKNTAYVSLLLFGFIAGYWVNEICLLNCGNYFWSLSFYLVGFFGLLWSVCWFWLFEDVNYVPDRVTAGNFKLTKLLSSMPGLCITILAVCCLLNFGLMSYIVEVLFEKPVLVFPQNFTMRQFLTCTTAVSSLIVGWLSDFLRGYYGCSTTNVRKAFICGGLFSSSFIILFITSFYRHKYEVITLCSCIGVFYILQGTLLIGCVVNPLDIAPHFSGLVAGVSLGIALILTEFIIFTSVFFESWDYGGFLVEFIILISLNTFGGIFFFTFGSGEEQKWAVIEIEANRLLENIVDNEIILKEEKKSQII